MIKRILLFIFLIVLFISVFAVLENNPRSVAGFLMKEEFPASTAVNFEIKLFGFLPIGDAIVEEKGITTFNEKNVHHIALSAKSKRVFSKILQMELRVSSYVDLESFLPVYYKELMKIKGEDDQTKEIEYNQDRNIMIMNGEKVKILPNTLDPLSAFNYIRWLDFEKVKFFDLNINSNQMNYIFRGEVDEVNYKIKGKNIRVWKLRGYIRRRDKDPHHASQVSVWFLDSKNRVPLFVKVFSSKVSYSARVSNIR